MSGDPLGCPEQTRHIVEVLMSSAWARTDNCAGRAMLEMLERLQERVFTKSFLDRQGLAAVHRVSILVFNMKVASGKTFEQLPALDLVEPSTLGYSTFSTFLTADGSVISAAVRWADLLCG